MEAGKVVQNAGETGRGVFVDTIIPGIITLLLSGIVIYIIRAFLIKSLRRNDKMEEKQKVRLVKTVTTALAIVAIIIVVSGYGLQTGSLLALIGVMGLSLSLSVQGLLSSFFSGCILPITKPFREGDIIEAGGTTGIIKRIGYFNTTLVTLENITVVIPNSVLTSGCITNYSTMETLKVERTFNVSPNTADEDVRAALLDAIGKDPRILADPAPVIRLESFSAMNAAYTVKVPCLSKDYNDVSYALVENVYASFKEHAIEMGSDTSGARSGGQTGSRGKGGQQSGGQGGRGGQQSGGQGGRGRGGQQTGGQGGNRGRSGQQSGDTGSSGGSAQQPDSSTGSSDVTVQQPESTGSGRGGNGQKPEGAGGGRGGNGQRPAGAGDGRGGSGQRPAGAGGD